LTIQGTKGSRFLCLMVFSSFVILRSVLTESCFGISFSSHHKVGIRSKIPFDWRGKKGKILLIHFCVAITESCFGISFSFHHKVGIRSNGLLTEEEKRVPWHHHTIILIVWYIFVLHNWVTSCESNYYLPYGTIFPSYICTIRTISVTFVPLFTQQYYLQWPK